MSWNPFGTLRIVFIVDFRNIRMHVHKPVSGVLHVLGQYCYFKELIVVPCSPFSTIRLLVCFTPSVRVKYYGPNLAFIILNLRNGCRESGTGHWGTSLNWELITIRTSVLSRGIMLNCPRPVLRHSKFFSNKCLFLLLPTQKSSVMLISISIRILLVQKYPCAYLRPSPTCFSALPVHHQHKP